MPLFWPPTRRAAGGRGRQPPGPLQPPAPAVRRNVVTRASHGSCSRGSLRPEIAARQFPAADGVLTRSPAVNGNCAARREASAVGDWAALRMKTATIGGPSPLRRKKLCPQGTINPVRATSPPRPKKRRGGIHPPRRCPRPSGRDKSAGFRRCRPPGKRCRRTATGPGKPPPPGCPDAAAPYPTEPPR